MISTSVPAGTGPRVRSYAKKGVALDMVEGCPHLDP